MASGPTARTGSSQNLSSSILGAALQDIFRAGAAGMKFVARSMPVPQGLRVLTREYATIAMDFMQPAEIFAQTAERPYGGGRRQVGIL